MRSTTLAVTLMTALAVPAAAQTAEEAVVRVAEDLFDAMRRRDADAIRRLMLPEGRLLAVSGGDGPAAPRWTDVEQFVQVIESSPTTPLERMWNPKVRVDGPIASIWTEYDFHWDQEFSHCGVDAFHLVRTSDGWRIAQITYTGRQTGCYSPLGPVGPAGRRAGGPSDRR